jgi:hypothetical protein
MGAELAFGIEYVAFSVGYHGAIRLQTAQIKRGMELFQDVHTSKYGVRKVCIIRKLLAVCRLRWNFR